MKTEFSNKAAGGECSWITTKATAWKKGWMTLGLACGMSSLAHAATINADFSEQASPLNQNDTTNVDAYPGRAGDGWASDWSIVSQANGSSTGTVKNDAAMGNHLQINYSATNSTQTASVLRRQFDSAIVSPAAPYLVEFSLRMDASNGWSGSSDSIIFYGNNAAGSGSYPASRSWALQLRANGTWRTFTLDGTANPSLTFAFTTGVVYDVSVWVNPADMNFTYQVVNTANSTATHQETPVAFTTTLPAQANSSSWLQFQTAMNANADSISWSMSDVGISPIPEPGVTAMAGLGLVALAWKVRRNMAAQKTAKK